MPSYISKNGVWTPAQEKAVNIHTGDVYKGPDREALREIEAAGGRMGQNANEDPENIMRARQLGITVEEYLNLNAPPTKQQQENEKAKEEMVIDQNKPPKANAKRGVQPTGGGADMAGQGQDIQGGFGKPKT